MCFDPLMAAWLEANPGKLIKVPQQTAENLRVAQNTSRRAFCLSRTKNDLNWTFNRNLKEQLQLLVGLPEKAIDADFVSSAPTQR